MKSKTILRLVLPSAKSLRLTAYLLMVGVGILTSSTRVLYAQAKEAAFGFGRELVGFAELTQGAELVRVNGEQFHYSMTVTSDSVKSVLDRLEQLCQTNPGLLGQLGHESKASRGDHSYGSIRNGVIRDEANDRGMVVCFAGKPIGNLTDVLSALERFAKTLNLTDFGRLRYSFAERRQDGRTRVVTIWSDTGLSLSRMFPSEGDAEGTDSPVLPRPPHSRRLLSADAAGVTSGLRMYTCGVGKRQVQSYYDRWMLEHGWKVAATAEASGAAAYIRHDGCQAIVTVLDESGETYVTLTETANAEQRVMVIGTP